MKGGFSGFAGASPTATDDLPCYPKINLNEVVNCAKIAAFQKLFQGGAADAERPAFVPSRRR